MKSEMKTPFDLQTPYGLIVKVRSIPKPLFYCLVMNIK